MPRRALTMRQDGRGAITRREWVSEGKEPGGLFSRGDTPQSRELKAQSTIATRNDHAIGEGQQIPPPQPNKNELLSTKTKVRFFHNGIMPSKRGVEVENSRN